MRENTTTFTPSQQFTHFFDKKILIIDNVELITRVVLKQLKSAGFHTVESENDSLKAIEKVEEFKPDLILLDIFMPHVSGLEILKSIRANDKFDRILVLMLSSAGADEQYQSLELGAFGFIQKPITAVNLVQTITKKFAMANRLGIL